MFGHLSDKVIKQIGEAVEIMKKGGVAAFPTDTVYGLGADAFNERAVAKIFEIKQRPRGMALPVLVADEAQADFVVAAVSGVARFLMKRFWPGGLTLILGAGDRLPALVTAGGDKVAVRVPDHIVPVTLIRELGSPVVGTSANISNSPSAATAREVAGQMGSAVDIIIDGGKCPSGLESTVVDATGQSPLIIRKGVVPGEEIMKAYREYLKEAGEHEDSSG